MLRLMPFVGALPSKRSLLVPILSLITLFSLWRSVHSGGLSFLPWNLTSRPLGLPCWALPGSEDTVLVIRTGSTEIEERLPVHLETSLHCAPHSLVFSDLDETFHGQAVLDALATVSTSIRETHADFALYRRLHSGGRASLNTSELSQAPEAFASAGGNAKNPGWKLDKWKFLPMLNETFYRYPNKKWYIFIEGDTFLLWTMALQYLAHLDHRKPLYAGSRNIIKPDIYAHGGSGFIVSQPAMQMATQYYAAHKSEIETFTDKHWAGDCVLGKYIRASGVPFLHAWPHFQGEYPGLAPYGKESKFDCAPVITYHHVDSGMAKTL